jgi:hypothetical protein
MGRDPSCAFAWGCGVKLFVNLYEKGVGGCVGYAYRSQQQADESACGNRKRLVIFEHAFEQEHIPAKSSSAANTFLSRHLTADAKAYYENEAKKRGVDPHELCLKVLSTIAKDKMIEPVLDDLQEPA